MGGELHLVVVICKMSLVLVLSKLRWNWTLASAEHPILVWVLVRNVLRIRCCLLHRSHPGSSSPNLVSYLHWQDQGRRQKPLYGASKWCMGLPPVAVIVHCFNEVVCAWLRWWYHAFVYVPALSFSILFPDWLRWHIFPRLLETLCPYSVARGIAQCASAASSTGSVSRLS